MSKIISSSLCILLAIGVLGDVAIIDEQLIAFGTGDCVELDELTSTLDVVNCDNGEIRQKWNFLSSTQEIRSSLNDECLSSTSSVVTTETCSGNDNQRWIIAGDTIINVDDGLCLDEAQNGNGNPPFKLITFGCKGDNNQKWQFCPNCRIF